jgi:hypothetical protein
MGGQVLEIRSPPTVSHKQSHKKAVSTIYTITINGNNMILSLLMPIMPSSNPIIERIEKTYTRM